MHIGVLYCIVSSMFLPRSNRNVSPATCYACATDRYGLLLLPGPRWSGWRAWEISAMHDCREPVSIPANSNAWHVMSSDTWTPSSTVMQKLSSRIVAGISDLDMHQKIVEERNLGEFETGEVLDGFGNRDIDVTLNALNNSCHTAQDQSVSVYRLMSNKLAQVLAFSAHIFGVCCPQRYLEFLEKKCNPCARLKPIEHWFGRVWSLEGRATGTEVLACCAASNFLCPTFEKSWALKLRPHGPGPPNFSKPRQVHSCTNFCSQLRTGGRGFQSFQMDKNLGCKNSFSKRCKNHERVTVTEEWHGQSDLGHEETKRILLLRCFFGLFPTPSSHHASFQA